MRLRNSQNKEIQQRWTFTCQGTGVHRPGCTKQYVDAAHRFPLEICKLKCVKPMMTEIQTIEGGWKDVSSLEDTT